MKRLSILIGCVLIASLFGGCQSDTSSQTPPPSVVEDMPTVQSEQTWRQVNSDFVLLGLKLNSLMLVNGPGFEVSGYHIVNDVHVFFVEGLDKNQILTFVGTVSDVETIDSGEIFGTVFGEDQKVYADFRISVANEGHPTLTIESKQKNGTSGSWQIIAKAEEAKPRTGKIPPPTLEENEQTPPADGVMFRQ